MKFALTMDFLAKAFLWTVSKICTGISYILDFFHLIYVLISGDD